MKKVLSIFLSFILLASHINLTVGTHFCGGEAVMSRLMISEIHLDCGMPNMDNACNVSDNQYLSFTKSPCCENHYQTIQASDDFIKDATQVNLPIELVSVFCYSMLYIDVLSQTTLQSYTYTPPPLLEKDIHILFQTFLI